MPPTRALAPTAAPRTPPKALRDAALERIKKTMVESKNLEPEKLGRHVYEVDLALHEVDLYDRVHDLSELLHPNARPAFVGAYYAAHRDGINHLGMKELAKATLSRTSSPRCTRIGIEPSTGSNNYTFMLNAAYEASPVKRIELHYENGASLQRFPGKTAATPAQLPASFLAELRAEHFGIKSASVEKGTVLIRVGNRFEPAYAGSVDSLVKGKLGDFPVELRVDNTGDAPVGYMQEGVEHYIHRDGSVVPILIDDAQMTSYRERFASLGVLAITSLPMSGTFVQVPEGTSEAKARELLAAISRELTSDHICLFAEPRDEVRQRPETYVPKQNVLVTRGLTFDDRGEAQLNLPSRDTAAPP